MTRQQLPDLNRERPPKGGQPWPDTVSVQGLTRSRSARTRERFLLDRERHGQGPERPCRRTKDDPNHVVLTTTDSNTWGGNSGHTYTLTEQPDGTTNVNVVVVREGKNLKGRMLAIVAGMIGKRMLEKQLRKTVKAIEARNDEARPAETSQLHK